MATKRTPDAFPTAEEVLAGLNTKVIDLEDLYQKAYDALENVAWGLDLGNPANERTLPREIELADIGGLAVLCDQVEVQLAQSGRMLESLRRAMVHLIAIRAEQQGRMTRGEAP